MDIEGHSWRLPSIRESASLVDEATVAPAINFDDGFTGFNAGSGNDWNAFGAAWARCVR